MHKGFKLLFFAILGSLLINACKTGATRPREITSEITDTIIQLSEPSKIYFDSLSLDSFINKYPKVQRYAASFRDFYAKNNYQYIWYHENGLSESAYGLVAHLLPEAEKDEVLHPIKNMLDSLLHADDTSALLKPDVQIEGMLTALYFYYTEKVLKGVDESVSRKLGWFIPRRKLSLPALLDSFLVAKNWDHFEQNALNSQYFKLKALLEKYRKLDDSGQEVILPSFSGKPLKPGGSADYVTLLRKRLVQLGYADILKDTSAYLADMIGAVNLSKRAYGLKEDSSITKELVQELSVPVKQRENQLLVNMERMRWIPARIEASDLIFVNIPDFKLVYFENGVPVWNCNVVVGTPVHKTVIFSGVMDYVVFSPYWYVPQSIINNEIGLSRAKSAAYLKRKNMEWSGGSLREKPGPNNSLGLVKFIFPNSNSIYLHDTPAKELFKRDVRAFSHGCIRVEKPFDLAKRVLSYDSSWTDARIQAAMHAGKEQKVILDRKVPVYIGYFTAFADKDGLVHFRKDVYKRDGEMMEMLAD
jgi:L,D-transpeptidase YcbB